MRLIVFLASHLIYLFSLSVFYFIWKKDGRAVLQIFLSMTLIFVLEEFLKTLFYFPRPFEVNQIPPLVSAAGSSFPSGHTMLAFAISTTILLRIRQSGSKTLTANLLTSCLFLASGLIGLARVLANVHFWHDILAGVSLGILVAVLVESVVEKVVKLLRK